MVIRSFSRWISYEIGTPGWLLNGNGSQVIESQMSDSVINDCVTGYQSVTALVVNLDQGCSNFLT